MRVNIKGATYFLTTVTNNRRRLFDNADAVGLLKNVILSGCKVKQSIAHAYAIMPDHYHLLVSLHESVDASDILHSINSYFSHKFAQGKRDVWKSSPWDEVIRSEFMYNQKLCYILLNPYRKGLVDDCLADCGRTNITDIRRIKGEGFLFDLFRDYGRKDAF